MLRTDNKADSYLAKCWMVSKDEHRVKVNISIVESDGKNNVGMKYVFVDDEIRPLVIHFANGKTITLKRLQEAIWIPPAMSVDLSKLVVCMCHYFFSLDMNVSNWN